MKFILVTDYRMFGPFDSADDAAAFGDTLVATQWVVKPIYAPAV